jgi:hypothetical protein
MKINLDRPFNIPARRVRVRELADELLAARAVIKARDMLATANLEDGDAA